ncbi:MAG TPA: AAA domain-containing protein [Candidatus Thalassarchaeaceae archaeon]|jgi:regulator of nonsense transcripts 1|nr:AAA domain-containing protein [Candidatus Thalassarchaeaceae archaeon]HJM67764.1 AAA domain-containing protein [Candidatus Thalassarchaeaceae archaeon]
MADRKGNVRRIKRGPPAGSSTHSERKEESDGISFPRSQDHFERFNRLIDWELEDEMSSVEERLRKWGRDRLVENGITLFDLEGRNDGWLFGERVVKLFTRGEALPHHRFRHGDIVTLSRKNPLKEKVIEGTVLSRSRKFIRIVVNEQPTKIRSDTWRLDRGANRVAHDRMAGAIESLFSDESSTLLRELIYGQVRDMESSSSRSANLGGIQKRLMAQAKHSGNLNPTQSKAFANAMEYRLSLIQGPPGTGKTHTAVRILAAWARNGAGPILAVADSNVAVDNLLEGLLEQGVKAVRLGQPVKVRESLRDATMAAQMAEHHLREDVEIIIELNENAMRRLPALKGKEKGLAHRDIKKGWKEVRRIENQMRDDILEHAQVICATCVGAGDFLLDSRRFPLVLLDEATQATEPASLIPLTKGARHVVLVGDHHQLPPTVISRRAEEEGLARSLFERLVALGAPSTMLTTQYRMHPVIREWPSERFYGGELEDGVSAEERAAPAGFVWPDWDAPVAFIPVEGAEDTSPDGASKQNMDEAGLAVRVVDMLLSGGDITPHDIGVVTPYSGQVRLLNDLFESAGGREQHERYHGLEIKTVDGYQGREKDVIVLSAVRANEAGELGFLTDRRRLNVAITRARRGLIVLGHPRTLRNDSSWASWCDWASERGLEAYHVLHM